MNLVLVIHGGCFNLTMQLRFMGLIKSNWWDKVKVKGNDETITVPFNLGISPRREAISDDFPAPTFPTTVTKEPLLMARLILLRVAFSSFESHLKNAHSTFTATGWSESLGSLTTASCSNSLLHKYLSNRSNETNAYNNNNNNNNNINNCVFSPNTC